MADDRGGDAAPKEAKGSIMGWMSDTQRGLAWFIVTAFVVLTFLWMLKPPTMPAESMAQLNQLVSTLQNILLIAIGFFFGSSTSSQKKEDQIVAAALAPYPPEAAPPAPAKSPPPIQEPAAPAAPAPQPASGV